MVQLIKNKMTNLLVPLTVTIFFLIIRSTFGIVDTTANPTVKNNCAHDAFIASHPFEDKVFLYPWKTSERKGDWNYNRAYCAQHCAEMVTIRNQTENKFFYQFMTHVGLKHPGVWLGAQINDKKKFTHWYNGEEATDYNPAAPGEYNEPGVTCLDIGWDEGLSHWRNYYCAGNALTDLHHVACQRYTSTTTLYEPENPKPPSNCNCNGNCITGWTASTNETHLCICLPTKEEKPKKKEEVCHKTTDLLIVLDSSGSIRPDNYQLAKEFVNNLATAFMVNTDSRIQFTTYSHDARVIVNLKNTLSPEEISSKILNAPYDAGETYTDLGINTALDDYQPNSRSSAVNMIVLTDGESKNKTKTAEAVERAILLGIQTFAIGITSEIDEEEVLIIAGGKSNHVFTTENFQELIKILAPLTRTVCSKSETLNINTIAHT